MTNVPVTFRALTQWPAGRVRTPDDERQYARFKSPGRYENSGTPQQRYTGQKPITLTQTLEDLDRELWQNGAENVVIQVDVANDRGIRADGWVRADARVNTPAIVLSFQRDGVPYVFACDHFKRWEDNLRAIVLGLEGLRRLERYHIAQAGDQYRGWQALPATATTALSTEAAANVLANRSKAGPGEILKDKQVALRAYREAAAAAHPDRAGGVTSDFQLVQEAKRVLEAHFGSAL